MKAEQNLGPITINNLQLNGRIWYELDGNRLLGKGRVELLERIDQSGSIRQAALQMEMSYKQAWDLIKDMNLRFSHPLVVSHRGGRGGGNAILTPKGKQVIEHFMLLNQKFIEFMNENSINLNL